MKLIFCSACSDLLRLFEERRTCRCGQAWGHYLWDGLHADIGGTAIPVGVDNAQLANALRRRPTVAPGTRFAAFVIPKVSETVRHADGETTRRPREKRASPPNTYLHPKGSVVGLDRNDPHALQHCSVP